MTNEEAMLRVKKALDSVRNPQTRQVSFEHAIIPILIELELLKIDDERPPQ